MAVLAFIRDQRSIRTVLPWAWTFASVRSRMLTVVCWTHSNSVDASKDARASGDLVEACREFLRGMEIPEDPEIMGVSGPCQVSAVIDVARQRATDVIVAGIHDLGEQSAVTTRQLMKQSPCNTIVLYGDPDRSTEARRFYVASIDSSQDSAALFLGSRLAESCNARVTLARSERDPGMEGQEIGRRELNRLIRDANVHETKRIECKVLEEGNLPAIAAEMDQHDLVLLSADYPMANAVVELTSKPTIALLKAAPSLRPWISVKPSTNWNPRLSAADYAELIQNLRLGSRLGADFLTMLSLASVVASIGLLQDSPAVVIGSMLLAPLMTPMVGCGIALAQANQKLGRTAMGTVAIGSFCTLLISFLIGLITPGNELTPQIYARGEPTMLDLVVALASAIAAAYALARPNLVGSIAGVAIATALVPPLCSIGLSLAYGDNGNAMGAALLFLTNFLAIVLGAALTFRLMGITAVNVESRQQRWVFRVVGIFVIAIVSICIPLHHALHKGLVETKPQPRAFPLAKVVIDAIEDQLQAHPDAKLISAGRPSSPYVTADVVLVLGSKESIDPEFARTLVRTVREKMKDNALVVEVHCLQEQWEYMAK